MEHLSKAYLKHYAEAKERLSKGPGYYHEAVNGGDFVIPEGVTDLADECLRGSTIDRLILPSTLKTIGIYALESDGFGALGHGCVFANCSIGEVVLPEGLEIIGTFAFGGSHIRSLTMYGKCLDSPYARQFKDCKIEQFNIYFDDCNEEYLLSPGSMLSYIKMCASYGVDPYDWNLVINEKIQ